MTPVPLAAKFKLPFTLRIEIVLPSILTLSVSVLVNVELPAERVPVVERFSSLKEIAPDTEVIEPVAITISDETVNVPLANVPVVDKFSSLKDMAPDTEVIDPAVITISLPAPNLPDVEPVMIAPEILPVVVRFAEPKDIAPDVSA